MREGQEQELTWQVQVKKAFAMEHVEWEDADASHPWVELCENFLGVSSRYVEPAEALKQGAV